MQFHYALVDDLLSREAFEQRVEAKIEECGDLIDEPAAAMLVVAECGRQHVKIEGLKARSSLFSFFGKVISKTEPREFDRRDGEKGIVASVIVGDETGQARIILWEERAMMTGEIEIGDVLEIIGRPSGRPAEITALAMRKATCEIECSAVPALPETARAERVDLEAVLIAKEEPRSFARRDGTGGEMVEGVIGDREGTARIVCWSPGVLSGIPTGATVRISGAIGKERDTRQGREFALDERTTVTLSESGIDLRLTPIGEIAGDGHFSIRGEVVWASPVREFQARDETISHVRNILVRDGTGTILVVIWGERSLRFMFPGETLEIYNASKKTGRDGDEELHVGRGAALVIPPSGEPAPISFTGTVLSGREGTFIDDGTCSYRIEADLPFGRVVRVRGTVRAHTIMPDTIEPVDLKPADLMSMIDGVLKGSGSNG
ncbi:MAG: OB-fold nucleic acid binding domain-containing protein [Methanoregulaceae archaeon]|nr:OB-fold nucleic acid binding domain-containing protein [Methanoregulaceae archaeon]